MGWAKFDDRYATHRKLLAAGLEATGLDARAICQCAGDLTDGFVADALLPVLAAGSKTPPIKLANKLVEVGRWWRDDERGGWWIHDYLDYNDTREEVERRREKERQRKASGRNTQGRDEQGRVTSARNPQGIRADGARNPAGVPPVPSPPILPVVSSSSSNHHGVVIHSPEEEVDPRVEEAVAVVAQRRLESTTSDVRYPPSWLATARANALAEDDGRVYRLAREHPDDAPAQLAARFLSAPSRYSSYEPTEPPGPPVEPDDAKANTAALRGSLQRGKTA